MRTKANGLFFMAICALIGSLPCARAEEAGSLTFEQHIAPIFATKCQQCHGEKVRKAELDLRTAAGIMRGGDSGAAIVPHQPDESLLYEYIHEGTMPPEEIEDAEKRPTEAEIETIKEWIAQGARFAKQPTSDTDEAVTKDQIVPIMLMRCTACHGRQKQEGGLDLRTRDSMLAGGESGPAIVPGKPEESLLLERIHAKEMPPLRELVNVSIKPIEPAEIELLTRWVKQGAPAGTGQEDVATNEPDPLVSDADRRFWSFQPPQQVSTPRVEGSGFRVQESGGQSVLLTLRREEAAREKPALQKTLTTEREEYTVQNPIDAFVLEKLEAVGLSLAPEADLRTLVRRAYFDLHGLPPSPEEIDAIVNDSDPRAYEMMIDRLLDSPRYGERWGRYWLDAAGYADSEGKTTQDLERQWAYRYRDYVIRAFNADKPYDRFLLEQLAGDELADYEHAAEITPEIYDNLVATGFLRMAPDATWSETINYVPDRLAIIADELHVLGSAVMGLTIQCARCHSHKFDPIPHRDYYRLAAVFKPALDEHDWLISNTKTAYRGTLDLSAARYLTHVLPEESDAVKAHNQPLQKQIDKLEADKQRKTREARERLIQDRLAKLPEPERDAVNRVLTKSATDRDEKEEKFVDSMAKKLEVDEKSLQADRDYKKQVEPIDKQLGEFRSKLKPPPLIRALWDRGEPSPTYILRRGDPKLPTRRVGPGVPSVLTDGRTPFDVQPPWPGAKSTGRRLAFAKWLTQPDHPLTARVMVNRMWMHHFGRGIVATPENFGKTGAPPTHPELLDWLAIEFVRRGWSIKAVHRLMMTSSTYRQSSSAAAEQQRLDPDNKLFSRMPLRRIEAESVRDSMLLVADRLDENRFGPPDSIDARGDGLVTVRGTERGWRRSIYVQQRRSQLPTLLESFDLPQMAPNCIRRSTSTVAPQALNLLNDAHVHELARRFAERVQHQVGDDPQRQIERAYALALGRAPTSEELQFTTSGFDELSDHWTDALEGREMTIETAAELWIYEADPDKVYDNDLISVWSKSTEGARRYGLVEFDVRKLADLNLKHVHLELSVMESWPLRQRAWLIPHGIAGATWNSYHAEKATSAVPLDSLGTYDMPDGVEVTGGYTASLAASKQDLGRIDELARTTGRITLALLPVEDGNSYRADWDDAAHESTNGKRPRLVVRFGEPDPAEINRRALTNVCHALLNSAEFVYVD